jgi:thioesterase domain-containing protein
VIVSKSAWKSATNGHFHRHQGAGGHDYMLHVPHFAENAAILRALLEECAPSKRQWRPAR